MFVMFANVRLLLVSKGKESISRSSHPVLASAVDRAAQLVALAEDASAKAVRGQAVAADDVVRLHRLADLHLRRLKLDRHDVRPLGQSLGDIFQDRAAFDATTSVRSE
jgi:hypothetical protein